MLCLSVGLFNVYGNTYKAHKIEDVLQEREIKGKITDNSGIPLPGVAVIIKGSNQGTQTDFDGNYIINAKAGEILMFSYIGMKTEERIIDAISDTINIEMVIILIYAEALLETGAIGDALTWLNMIPDNRGASTEATKENILLERRKELCFEGFRFDDLARTKQDIPKLNVVFEGPVYGSYNYAFPIPLAELNANSNMILNKGY